MQREIYPENGRPKKWPEITRFSWEKLRKSANLSLTDFIGKKQKRRKRKKRREKKKGGKFEK
jgi:hypothetical protein